MGACKNIVCIWRSGLCKVRQRIQTIEIAALMRTSDLGLRLLRDVMLDKSRQKQLS